MSLIPIRNPGIRLPTLEFLQVTEDTNTLSSYTFSNQDFGDAHASRLLVATVFFQRSGGGTVTLSSATIGGVSATIVAQTSDQTPADDISAALIQAEVPTGTSGDVVINPSNSCLCCAIGLYRVTKLKSTTALHSSTDTDDVIVLGGVVDIPVNAVAVAGAVWAGTGAVTITDNQSNTMTEDYDQAFDTSRQIAGGSAQLAAASSYSAGLDGPNTDAAGVLAIWR